MAMQQELLLAVIALLAAVAVLIRFARRWPAQSVDPKQVDREFLRRLAQGGDARLAHHKRPNVDPRIEHEFNKVFMTTTKEGKEALIGRLMVRQKCGRLEAMQMAVEEWRRENR